MPELSVVVEGVEVVPFAMAPQLAFALRVTNAPEDEVIHTAVLNCQLRLEVVRRRYAPEEEARLRDLFGEPERWGQTLRGMLWTHAGAVLPRFSGSTVVPLRVPCTYDFNLAATKYFHALADGEVPLNLLFSGTVFYEDAAGALQVAPVSWNLEASFRLPVAVWRGLMEAYYPNQAFLPLRQDLFDRLYEYKVERGIPTWEQVVEELLPSPAEATRK